MRYWVYINDKVDGPYEEDKLVSLEGFTPETLICSEEIEEGGSQEWVKASSIFEFDEAAKTMTRAPLTEEELNTVRGSTAGLGATSPITAMPVEAASATQILIEKIDILTREIEDLKGKLDKALAAPSVMQAPLTQHNFAAEEAEQTARGQQADTVTEEALITNTESLVNHAEKLIAQASATSTGKPIDFLDEIEIGGAKNENLGSEKGGEEVVLRSALDSLYGAKEQTEEEKEATFQDLLSPVKTATNPDLAAQEKEEEKAPQAEQIQPQAEQAPAQTEAAQEPEQAQTESEESAAPAELSEDKREEIIAEITAPAQQDNLILQAIEEAQKEEQAAADLASLDAAPQAAPEPEVKEQEQTGPQLELPSAEAQPEAEPAPEAAEKQPLDLTGQEHLNIVSGDTAPKIEAPQQAEPLAQMEQPSDALTPMNPSDVVEEGQKEITETVKELVPGKKLEPSAEDGIISQKDLEDAFTERSPVPEFTVPADNQQPAPEQTQQSGGALPEGKGFYNPSEMTEVELKEGSTYLISDFIPPAQSKSDRELLAEQARLQKEKEQAAAAQAAIAGSPEAAQAAAEAGAAAPQAQTVTETVEEIVPAKKADHNDITLSKVILENTIKTKRGATMDIKTVPMVQEPADTERLDLTDSELDINTQHDLREADFKQPGTSLTKIILGILVSLVILAVIYVMLAYLELLPAKFNVIKSGPSAEETQARSQQLNEMLGPDADGQAADAVQSQQAPYGAAQPLQLPAGAESQIAPQPMQTGAQPANPLAPMLAQVQNYPMVNGQTLQQLINSRHPAAQNLIEWNITTAVEPDNYSVLVKVPPENPQSFKISYRFNYNAVTGALEPTISDSKNLLDSLRAPQPAR